MVEKKAKHTMLNGEEVEADVTKGGVTIENHKVKPEQGTQFKLNHLCAMNKIVKHEAQRMPDGRTVVGMRFNTLLWSVEDEKGEFKRIITKLADHYKKIGHKPDHGLMDLPSGSIRIADILYPEIGGEDIRTNGKILAFLTDILNQMHRSSVELLAAHEPNFVPVYKNFPSNPFEATLNLLRVGDYIFVLDLRDKKDFDAFNSIDKAVKIPEPDVYVACNINGSQVSSITRV